MFSLKPINKGLAALFITSSLIMFGCGGGGDGGSNRVSAESLDDLYNYNGELGVTFAGNTPTLRVWAPTADDVEVRLYDTPTGASTETLAMTLDESTGVWSIEGDSTWNGLYYVYRVDVGRMNTVTDPYSVALSTDSKRSQILNLQDPQWKPTGWDAMIKPELNSFNDIALYELHVRDFSISDDTVPAALQGKYGAFALENTNSANHLERLADAGITHIHLLPTFDIASVIENENDRREPSIPDSVSPASNTPAREVDEVRDQDGFNWGYDPYHYGVPEGSYAQDPNGGARIKEFREMIKGINDAGLRTVMDVVYNHTAESGTGTKSVLDKVVPGYYHRYDANGNIHRSTCCENTASENEMMEKLMIDTIIRFAVDYKVDGFRFDLMGHHTKQNLANLRLALDNLTIAQHGVDGSKIYVYGEGWDFGEVYDNALFVNASQKNMAGTGIGTFNDRQRDALRGGGPFGDYRQQGYINADDYSSDILLHYSDLVRLGLAGTQQNYAFTNKDDVLMLGRQFDYNGSPLAGYGLRPTDIINYASAHDNETLFDVVQIKAGDNATLAERIRMHNLGNAIVALSQGIPFFHAGVEILRSKSMDRNSYNSGDWFNKLDYSYATNNWAVGLPPAHENSGNYNFMETLLEDSSLKPSQNDIMGALSVFEEFLAIRMGSPLFRLQTSNDISNRVKFYNTGSAQQPGLIVMALADNQAGVADLDPIYEQIVVVINASGNAQLFSDNSAPWVVQNSDLVLHPCLSSSSDFTARTSSYSNNTFNVPARTAAVFVEADTGQTPVCR